MERLPIRMRFMRLYLIATGVAIGLLMRSIFGIPDSIPADRQFSQPLPAAPAASNQPE